MFDDLYSCALLPVCHIICRLIRPRLHIHTPADLPTFKMCIVWYLDQEHAFLRFTYFTDIMSRVG